MSEPENIELDWSGLDLDPAPKPIMLEVGRPPEPPPLRIEVSPAPTETDDVLVAALTTLNDRLQAAEERQLEITEIVKALAGIVNADRENLSAALDAITAALMNQPAPVVNVAATEIPAPIVNVPAPIVNVHVPKAEKRINITRDPVSGMIASANIEEI